MCAFTAMEEEEPPVNKTMTFLMLPDDLVINCLARISRLYYPSLSLVSKRFRSFLASTELYQTRTLLGRTESCLYVCLRFYSVSSKPIRWYTLSWKPNSSRRILVPISSPNNPSLSYYSGIAAIGSNIYVIYNESNDVMVMDCCSHTWHEAPSMQVPLVFPNARVLDGKIYVTKYRDFTSIEVFDTKTEIWSTCEEEISLDMRRGFLSSHCMIENVFYRLNNAIDWYDHKERLWKSLKGLETLSWFPNDSHYVKLAGCGCGGKIAVLWKKRANLVRETNIWCAEIAIERRQNGEIWGNVEWTDIVYTTNELFSLLHVVSTTI